MFTVRERLQKLPGPHILSTEFPSPLELTPPNMELAFALVLFDDLPNNWLLLEASVWPNGLAVQEFVPWLADILLFPWWLLLLLSLLLSFRKLSALHT